MQSSTTVISIKVDALSFDNACEKIIIWGTSKESRTVVFANVHVVVSAVRNMEFGATVAAADLVLPDGAPIAWMMRKLGIAQQERVSGPDLMWSLLEKCAQNKISVYFYGGTPETLEALISRVSVTFSQLIVAGAESPPFRTLSKEESSEAVDRINGSGAGLVFVGLGCPKQEHWMMRRRGAIAAVMLGVGAAFDFHAGTVARAPHWMRKNGLEWLHRLFSEPQRLWKRYLFTNSFFIAMAIRQLLRRY